uniref:OTU domain-containing protein n=1 Tax=Alexandrium monilatum TaxID=311494 RepID=A0A7S4UVV4_9DINO
MGQTLGAAGDAPSGLERIREGGDGNCLFHAIARQALGDPRLDGRARGEVCDWMEVHLPPSAHAAGRSALTEAHRAMVWEQRAEVLACGSGDDTPVLAYIRSMRRHGEWGTGLEALCAAYRYGRVVHVWSPGGFSELRPPSALMQSGTEPIRLLHNGRNHWDSALSAPTSSGSAGADADEDAMVAMAVAESLADADPSGDEAPPVAFPLTCEPDERAARRAMAAAAAERREQNLAVRGLGPKARTAVQTQLQGRTPQPSATAASSSQAETAMQTQSRGRESQPSATAASSAKEAKGDAKPAGSGAPCRGSASSSAVVEVLSDTETASPGPPEQPAAAAAAPTSAESGSRWTRRRAARAAAARQAEDAAGAGPSGATLLADVEICSVASAAAAAAGVDESEDCLMALCRVGLSRAEAMEALARSNGDVASVKALYCIDWDSSGRTLQKPFVAQS